MTQVTVAVSNLEDVPALVLEAGGALLSRKRRFPALAGTPPVQSRAVSSSA